MSANQRKYFRCPIEDSQQSVELTVGWRRVKCRLVEMSIGGFGVVAPKPIRVTGEQAICMKAGGLNNIVRVTHQEPCDDGVFIGLKQVEELLTNERMPLPTQQWMIPAAWIAALGTVAAAAYCLLGLQASIPQ